MKILKALLVSIFSLFVIISPAYAKIMVDENGSITIAADQVINDDLFIAADAVDIQGVVNGDVYVGAGVVDFSGIISGDLVIGAGQTTINGQIGQDLIVGAGDVDILSTSVVDGVVIGAGQVNIDDQSNIGGSLITGTGTLDNQASVGKNILAGAGLITHNAPVGGAVHFGADEIELGDKTVINGDLTYYSESSLQKSDQAIIKGETYKKKTPRSSQLWSHQNYQAQFAKSWPIARLSMHFFSFLAALIVAFLTIKLIPKLSLKVADNIRNKFFPSLGWGLLVFFLAFPAIMLIAITGIGLPLSLILTATYLIDLYLAKIFVSLAIGKAFESQFNWKKTSPYSLVLIGLLTYYILRFFPVLGDFTRILSLLLGLGGIWLAFKQYLKKL